MNRYDHVIQTWDEIFQKDECVVPSKKESGNPVFDAGLKWLIEGTNTVLDFGCGNGVILLWCCLYGTKKHIGIDLSKEAIKNAELCSQRMNGGEFQFVCGSIEQVQKLASGSIDAVVLSNILDNLYPEDALCLLEEVKRVLVPGGKVLVKLNPHITAQQIEEWNIKVIEGNLLDDGLILWNNTEEQWREILSKYFTVAKYDEIYYEEYEQTNRMYRLVK